MAPGQALLDLVLLGKKPVEGIIDLVGGDPAEPRHGAKRMARRLLVERARRGQFGGGIDQPGNNQRQSQVPPPLRTPSQQPVQPDPLERPENRHNMAVRHRPDDLQPLSRRHQIVTAQDRAQGLDLRRRPMAEIGKRAVLHLVAIGGNSRF